MAEDDNKPVNKKDLMDVMVGFSESILNGVQKMFDQHEESNNKRFTGIDQRLDRVENRLDKLETEVSEVKDEIKGLKSDLSTTVTKKEFNELKDKVEDYIATN